MSVDTELCLLWCLCTELSEATGSHTGWEKHCLSCEVSSLPPGGLEKQFTPSGPASKARTVHTAWYIVYEPVKVQTWTCFIYSIIIVIKFHLFICVCVCGSQENLWELVLPSPCGAGLRPRSSGCVTSMPFDSLVT